MSARKLIDVNIAKFLPLFLKQCNEPRGLGGLCFEDLNEGGFACDFDFIRSVGEYIDAYLPIVQRRRYTSYGKRERNQF